MAAPEVSYTRLYVGNLPADAAKGEIQDFFDTHGAGKITEVKLMNGYCFIEYEDAADARDVVPDGQDFKGKRIVVQFARGSRRNEGFPNPERIQPRPRRTQFRMQLTGLPPETSWQDLKDFARQPGLDVVYSEIYRERDGRGYVEYESAADLKSAVEKLDNQDFRGQPVRCIEDIQPADERARDRYRSRSPPTGRRGNYPPREDQYYDRRGPPRGYSPSRDDYRRRSPPPRDYYESRDQYRRSSPRPRAPPADEYGAPRGRHGEGDYDARPPPARRPYEGDSYTNGHGRPYDRQTSPRRARSPARSGYEGSYDRRAYWPG